jgi:hypothetical protein
MDPSQEDAQLTNVVVFIAPVPVAFVVPLLSMLMWFFVIVSNRRLVLGRRAMRPGPSPPSMRS